MKKLISIGVALALLVTFMVPVAVGAEEIVDPGEYAKTPFGILGSGIQLIGDILLGLSGVIDPFIEDYDMETADIAGVTDKVGEWTGVNLAWMTDMGGWSMVAVGDVFSVITPLAVELGFDQYIKPVADVFYVIGARIFDAWGDITSTGTADLPGPGIGLPVYGG